MRSLLLCGALLLTGCHRFDEELQRWDDAHDAGATARVCAPGSAPVFCYSGPEASLQQGTCRGGLRHCNDAGTAYGPCEDEVTPGMEGCN